LFIDIDPVNFDVNIHPQKREVLFYDEKTLRSTITSSVSYSLKAQNIVPQFTPKLNVKTQQTLDSIKSKEKLSIESPHGYEGPSINVHRTIGQSELFSTTDKDQQKIISSTTSKKEKIDLFKSDLKYRGQLGKEFLNFEDIATNDLILRI
jgi:DNA mismatch repair protein MutL